MKITLTICCSLLCLLAVAQNNTLSKSTYSVKYPADWIVEPGADAQQFTIKAPADSGLVDNFVENLNMVINDITGYDAKQYAAFSKGYLPSKIKQFKVITDKKGDVKGKDSWFLVFKGIQFGKKLQWKQYYIIKGNKVHILTFTAEASRWNQYSKVADMMIDSYYVK